MDKLKQWWLAHRPTGRKWIQLYAALLYNAHVRGYIDGTIDTGVLKKACVPGLNCYSCPGAVAACPLGALQNALASSGARAPSYVLGILLLFGLMLGRTVCGFLCPVGLAQELLHRLPTPKIRKSRATRVLSYLKYIILFIFVVLIPLIYAARKLPVPAFCKYICPAGTIEGALALLMHPANRGMLPMLGVLFTRKFIIAVFLVTLSVFVYRVFCRFLCPLGALYGLFNRVSILGISVDAERCVDCGRCRACCGMDIRCPGDHECIACGECISACPTGAIRYRKIGKSKAPIGKAVLTGLAVLFLAAVLIVSNQAPAKVEPVLPDESLIGYEPGDYLRDFTCELYSGGGTFDSREARGKVTVINFWATWCAPCCTELTYFDQLHREYGEEVSVIAIHSDLITDDVQTYIDGTGFGMPFGQDPDGSIIASLGGSAMLPQTVIVDADGRIVFNQVGSVTYEQLAEQALACK